MLSLTMGLWPGLFAFCIPIPVISLQFSHKVAHFLQNNHAIAAPWHIFCLVVWYCNLFDLHLGETVDEVFPRPARQSSWYIPTYEH